LLSSILVSSFFKIILILSQVFIVLFKNINTSNSFVCHLGILTFNQFIITSDQLTLTCLIISLFSLIAIFDISFIVDHHVQFISISKFKSVNLKSLTLLFCIKYLAINLFCSQIIIFSQFVIQSVLIIASIQGFLITNKFDLTYQFISSHSSVSSVSIYSALFQKAKESGFISILIVFQSCAYSVVSINTSILFSHFLSSQSKLNTYIAFHQSIVSLLTDSTN